MTQRFWRFIPWLPYDLTLEKLVKHSKVENPIELFQAGWYPGEIRKEPFPLARLRLTLRDHELDCFFIESRILVSERIRRVMDLPSKDIQYFEVDARQSIESLRSKDYKIMHVPVTDDISDLTKSVYSVSDENLDGPVTLKSVTRIATRPEASPCHELFHDRFFRGYIFCSDALALRILKSECTGVRFIDPLHLGMDGPMRFRTLRGVEEGGEWDPISKTEPTRVIELID